MMENETNAILQEARRLKDEASTYIKPELLDLIVRMAKQIDRLEHKRQSLNHRLNNLDDRTSTLIRLG